MVGMLDSLSLKNTKLGLETLELMGYDPRRDHAACSTAPTAASASASRDVDAVARARRPTSSSRADREIPRAVNEGVPIVARPAAVGARPRRSARSPTLSSATRAAAEPAAAPAARRARRRAAVGSSEERATMELHERLSQPSAAARSDEQEPFAELKNRDPHERHRRARPAALQRRRRPGELRDRVTADIRRHLLNDEPGISRDDRERLDAEIADDILGYGPLERLLADDSITEIMVNGPDDVWIERQRPALRDDRPLHRRVAPAPDHQQDRRRRSAGASTSRRRWSTRASRTAAASTRSSRRSRSRARSSRSGSSAASASRLRGHDQHRLALGASRSSSSQRCIEAQCNILISGGTGSGKTTLLNALSAAIPDNERIVTIEDAAELQLNQRHVLRLEARPPNIEGEGEIPIRDLVRNSLRMRPDRIIVGEVRGAEALDMLQAMNTGHDGSLSTVHANSPRDAPRTASRRWC